MGNTTSHTKRTKARTYVHSLLSQIRIHTLTIKKGGPGGDSLEHMHIETTEKRKGVGAAVVSEKGGSERKGSGRKSAR